MLRGARQVTSDETDSSLDGVERVFFDMRHRHRAGSYVIGGRADSRRGGRSAARACTAERRARLSPAASGARVAAGAEPECRGGERGRRPRSPAASSTSTTVDTFHDPVRRARSQYFLTPSRPAMEMCAGSLRSTSPCLLVVDLAATLASRLSSSHLPCSRICVSRASSPA